MIFENTGIMVDFLEVFIIFFAGKGYGPLYNWLENFDFVKAYGAVAIIIFACGAVMMLFNKKFDDMIEG